MGIPSGITAWAMREDLDACPHEHVWAFDEEWSACQLCGVTIAPTAPSRGVGRPSKFTAEAQERIVEGLSQGEMQATAAHAAGVHGDTLAVWLRSKDPKYELFQLRCQRARGEFRARMERLTAATKPDTWLKHSARKSLDEAHFPDDHWGDGPRAVDVRHSGGVVHAHVDATASGEIDYSTLSDAELQLLERMHERLALPAPAGADVIDATVIEDEPSE